jgi:glycosyl transferase family 25
MIAEACILSLDRATERRPQVNRTIATCPIPCSVISAVDGGLLSNSEISRVYRRRLHTPAYIAELRRAEIGCFLSHRKAWQKIATGAADVVLVLEDDMQLQQPQFDAALKFALANISPGDYLKFHAGEIQTESTVLRTSGPHSILRPHVAPLGATSQLITREAAQRLLDSSVVFDRPVDTFIQMTWITGVSVKVVTPCCIAEISRQLGGSTISQKKNLWTSLMREFRRPVYRMQINLLSRRHRNQISEVPVSEQHSGKSSVSMSDAA